jgi:tRNA-splicing ligase RtcB
MDISALRQLDECTWQIDPQGPMRVPAIIYADAPLITEMDEKVREQLCNVAALPGIVGAAWAMPDAHWGYGFPIGGVAAFTPEDGVVSAGGVGFDISCGVRTHLTGLRRADIDAVAEPFAEALFREIPAGIGSTGKIALEPAELEAMLAGGARWAVERGFGTPADLDRIEERGHMPGACPQDVSTAAKTRQRRQIGTLGSGNHYLEVQEITEVFHGDIAAAFGLERGAVVLTVHCGSRGLGHQIGTDFLREMVVAAAGFGITLPDRDLACAPIASELGQRYLGAMRAAINSALANRQILTHLAREVFARFFPDCRLELLFDVSHNTCKEEIHALEGAAPRPLFVHRKGATRAFGPGHPELPPSLAAAGQPIFIGGSMGTASAIMAGPAGAEHALASACHGAGRRMSRHQALRQWHGRQVVDDLARQGVIVRSISMRGVAEEAPGAYKDIDAVVEAAEKAGLARKVARLAPLICIKG